MKRGFYLSLLVTIAIVQLVLLPADVRAEDADLSDVYPSFVERMVLFWTNVARMDHAKMPTPHDDPQDPHANWSPPPGGEHDCPPVMYNRQLGEAARFHAQDMADKNYFDHNSADGTTFDQRIARFRYGGGAVGENIAMGQATAEEVVKGWMMSPGHRHNILLCAYENDMDWLELGTGYGRSSSNPTGPRYWVQDFGAGGGDQDFLPALPAGVGYRK
ncbi:MAG: CAP domain-containing protein, partial [Deltaproteobacteria bacterium]|nr:CAP domain-containing protein [Deltaproteobacteria bacterium]